MTKTFSAAADYQFAESIRDQLIKQLTLANEQLEQFAYVASHDLREPLRIIVSFTETNCNNVLQQALEALGESINSTGASVHSDPLPTVVANPIRFSCLFQNLIGNALKHQPQGNLPIVRITAQDKNDCWQFAVTDNGLGIESEYLEAIFAPFKRLHSDHEYFGTGIGLAICRRIVESFDGKLWAESVYGKGSTFYFTIPKK